MVEKERERRVIWFNMRGTVGHPNLKFGRSGEYKNTLHPSHFLYVQEGPLYI